MINLEELLRSSMMVFDGMPTTAEPLAIGDAITYDCEGCFCMNNGIIGFVHKHTAYVMP